MQLIKRRSSASYKYGTHRQSAGDWWSPRAKLIEPGELWGLDNNPDPYERFRCQTRGYLSFRG